MNFAWATEPGLFVVLTLAAYRTAWAWLRAMLPPLPWLRAKIQRSIERRVNRRFTEADGSLSSDGAVELGTYLARRGGQPTWSYLVTCFTCVGFWAGLGWVLAASLLPRPVWLIPAGAFALSAVAGLLSPDHE